MVVALVAVVLAVLVGAWVFSSRVHAEALLIRHLPPEYPHDVLAAGAGTLTLRVGGVDVADLRSSQLLGVAWENGYGQLGALLDEGEDRVTRAYTHVEGDPPPPGSSVLLDGFALPSPAAAGIAVEHVRYRSPLGDFDAWQTAGDRDTWVVFVHGRGVHRGEALRLLPSVIAGGFPTLTITYRNDRDQVAAADGLARFGAEEWEDLEAAVRWVAERAAGGVVLVGYSMGGAIAASFLEQSPLASLVRGLVLDAPALDFEAMIAMAADADPVLRRLPAPWRAAYVELTRRVTAWRFGFDWAPLDYVDRADALAVPVLLFHGADDDRVPVTTSDRLAAARPGLVTYERYEGTGHVRAWNVDRDRYVRAVLEFLAGIERRP